MQKMEKTGNAKTDGVGLLLRLVVTSSDGKVLSDTGKKPSKSFVIQFLEFIYGMFSITDVLATDVNGAETYLYANLVSPFDQFKLNAPVADDTHGIVVGTNDGSTPEANGNNKLDSQCMEGEGAGQMKHGGMIIGTAGIVGVNVDIEMKRAFTNLSGATITVEEVGVYCKRVFTTNYYHCTIRDVITGVEVPNACSLTVYYTKRTTV